MTTVRTYKQASEHFKLFGIGAGPANLSLASLLYNKKLVSNIFVELKESFTWHDDQLIDGATLQVSLFKDLVTLSDPTNPFSFLAYLHEKGRIYHFLNAQFDEIPRREFRNYMAWAAEKNKNIHFGETVLDVDFHDCFHIRTSKRYITADNISVGVGTQPWIPEFARCMPAQDHFHISQYMLRSNELAGKRVAVVGGGQSGAEVFLDLISKPHSSKPSQVTWVSRRRNFFPIDNSTFTNDFYMPCYSDYFSALPTPARERATSANILTSDGISESTLKAIYQKLYYCRFVDEQPRDFVLFPNRSVNSVSPNDNGGWCLETVHNDLPHLEEAISADIVIWATGFKPAGKSFLNSISHKLRKEDSEFLVDEDFAVQWDGPRDRAIFVQNGARGQRGLPDVNLSLNAWRAQRIVGRLTGDYALPQSTSFIDWNRSQPYMTSGVEGEIAAVVASPALKSASN